MANIYAIYPSGAGGGGGGGGTPTGDPNTIAIFNALGNLDSLPAFTLSTVNGGWDANLTTPLQNNASQTFFNYSLDVDPTENAPNSSVFFNNINIEVDPNDTGFDVGTAGLAVRVYNADVNNLHLADMGEINFIHNSFNVGNGTDPITLRGISYAYGFGNINDNVTVDGPLQGYGFQPNISSGASISNAVYISPFYDAANIQVSVPFYTSANFSPTISAVKNNAGYNGVNIAPQIDDFEGNASFTGVNISGNIDTFDTGNYQGILISPTVASVVNATGIFVGMNNVTASGNKRAAIFQGDVDITGNLSFSGALSIGKLTAFATEPVVNGGGNPTTINSLISAPTVAANATIANADTIGLNTAMLLQMGDNATVTSTLVGLAALALPAVVEMGAGSTVDRVSGATFAISLAGTATGGTIDELPLCRAVAIPNGITAINKLRGFQMDLPFGDPGTVTHGVYITPAAHNFMAGDLKIGGSDVVTNASVGLEVDSTTKAVLLSRMTTTERDALTAVNGMLIYNTATNKFQGYENGAWADLI